MKKFKLIKKYPNSGELGTIMEFYGDKESPSNYPEFWEEIKEKDYEILSFRGTVEPCIYTLRTSGKYSSDIKNTGTATLKHALNNPNMEIYSVKRKSDGEIFTINDNINNGIEYRKIESFYIYKGVFYIKHNKGVLSNEPKDGIFHEITKVKTSERKERPSVNKYIYEGKTYIILGYVPFKEPSTREWKDAVHYLQLESGLDFVREQGEFFKQFKLIE